MVAELQHISRVCCLFSPEELLPLFGCCCCCRLGRRFDDHDVRNMSIKAVVVRHTTPRYTQMEKHRRIFPESTHTRYVYHREYFPQHTFRSTFVVNNTSTDRHRQNNYPHACTPLFFGPLDGDGGDVQFVAVVVLSLIEWASLSNELVMQKRLDGWMAWASSL